MARQAGSKPVSEPVRIPAPWGGLNTRDGIATLQPQEARQLENWTPVGSTVSPRPGTTLFSDSAETDACETLGAYDGVLIISADAEEKAFNAGSKPSAIFCTWARSISLWDPSAKAARMQTEIVPFCSSSFIVSP